MLSLSRTQRRQKHGKQLGLRPRSLRFDVLEHRRLLALSMAGAPIDLGAVKGFSSAIPWEVGEGGQVYGTLDKGFGQPGPDHAFYYAGKIRDVGTLSATQPDVQANDINRKGQVVGYCADDADYTVPRRAFLYDNGKLEAIPTLGGASNEAWDINDAGKVAGSSWTSSGPTHAFRYDTVSDTMLDLGPLNATFASTYGTAINTAGFVAGNASDGDSKTPDHLFLYDGAMHDLGAVAGYESLMASGINDAGKVFGQLFDYGSQSHQRAFFYNGKVLKNIGVLRGNLPDTYASAMNSAGKVVGTASNNANSKIVQRAFLYDGKMRDLGALGSHGAWANDINDAGQVVGGSYAAGHPRMHAFVYDRGKMIDLNKLLPARSGWELQNAFGINNRQQVVGIGVHNGKSRPFLLTLRDSDRTGPKTSHVKIAPTPTSYPPKLKATISDGSTGRNVLVAAEYFIDTRGANGTGIRINAVFNRVTQTVTVTLDAQAFDKLGEGRHRVFVHGKDAVGNWGAFQSAVFVKRFAVLAPAPSAESQAGGRAASADAARDAAILALVTDSPADEPIGLLEPSMRLG